MQLNQENAIIQQIKNREIDLPSNYQNAIVALKQCDEIDEVKDFKDKMAAATLYYKQSKDIRLLNYATRIKLRAERRLGELIKQFDGRPHNALKQNDVNVNLLSQESIIKSIGITERQKTDSIRLANIPEEKFEQLIESEKIPTKTELAEIGTNKRLKEVSKNFAHTVEFGTLLHELETFMKKYDAIYILDNMDQNTKERYKNSIDKIENWFDNFIVNL